MNGHKIVLSNEFLEDFSVSKNGTYVKTQKHLEEEPDKQCRRWEYRLASCLNGVCNAINASSRPSDGHTPDEVVSKEFKKVLQCSKEFKEYESCIRKCDT
ncbi:aminotransferase class V-fold PLP-dependent enzyme [Babesia caballi]|uniref:Aminotransferase class V-fold PLP-dependent enzyme n=1 Tax=Babesia caballi TaxID=5871 RepID=A0AAV4LNJ2_BABCB|nr:aminotransferase class V-fold PLP-dependent enzyme [Babesia caballi]